MTDPLIEFLAGRPDATTFLPPRELEGASRAIFGDSEWLLPRPYRIHFVNESDPITVGFPVASSAALSELAARAEIWLNEEIRSQSDSRHRRDKAQSSFQAYITHLLLMTENAMQSNLLNDYHGILWLLHSRDLAAGFASIPRRVAQAGHSNGDLIKYRTFANWAAEVRKGMAALAERLAATLDGEEKRAVALVELLIDNVLILTEEFVSRDFRELRSYLGGHLRRDPTQFRDQIESLRSSAEEVINSDPFFRAATEVIGIDPSVPVGIGHIFDRDFRRLLLEHPTLRGKLAAPEVTFLDDIARRLGQFGILNQLRGGVRMMETGPTGETVAAGNPEIVYSRSTRPIDFGRPGVVDPMVHRFGLMYDISSFSETLSDIARLGVRGEVTAYRQMVVFQRRLESITERHRLQFEKFLGDGAFYTSRRALRLVHAAIEIQRYYAEMRRRGFAFNKGLRIAVNYGYYRLLPTQRRPGTNDRVMEFYGPGVVELSRLTTGKATKEIQELETFLITHGYDATAVQDFFAPLARGADVVDPRMHEREFYAYVNANGHLVNEGMVASSTLVEAISAELVEEGVRDLVELRTDLGDYVAFPSPANEVEYVGVRLIGRVALKGLAELDVAEIIAAAPGVLEASPIEEPGTLIEELRRELVSRATVNRPLSAAIAERETSERPIDRDIAICATEGTTDWLVMLGEWDAVADALCKSISLSGSELERLLGIDLPLTVGGLKERRNSLRNLYRKMSVIKSVPAVQLGPLRQRRNFAAFVLSQPVEKM